MFSAFSYKMAIGNVFVGVIVLVTTVVKCEPEAQKNIMPIMVNNYWHASPSSTTKAKDLVALLMPLITLNQKRLAMVSSQNMPLSMISNGKKTPSMVKGKQMEVSPQSQINMEPMLCR